jgi:hypothetical protein
MIQRLRSLFRVLTRRRDFEEGMSEELADFVPGNKIRVMWRNPLCGVRA